VKEPLPKAGPRDIEQTTDLSARHALGQRQGVSPAPAPLQPFELEFHYRPVYRFDLIPRAHDAQALAATIKLRRLASNWAGCQTWVGLGP
jgi:hypothetical protein